MSLPGFTLLAGLQNEMMKASGKHKINYALSKKSMFSKVLISFTVQSNNK